MPGAGRATSVATGWRNRPAGPLNGGVFVMAHISDIHLDGTDEIAARTRRVVDYLIGIKQPGRIDCVLVTGDLADHGADEEYEEVRKSVYQALPYPVLFCPGNHDDRVSYHNTLMQDDDATWVAGAPINTAHVIKDVTVLMCDSSIPRRNEGVLTAETLHWLDAELGRAGGPTFV